MIHKFLIIFISIFLSMNTYAERIMGYIIPGKDLLAIGQQKTQLRICPECEADWYDDAEAITLREYANQITRQQALTLLLNRTHQTIYLGLGAKTKSVYFINFGNIEGPFDDKYIEGPFGDKHTEAPGGKNL